MKFRRTKQFVEDFESLKSEDQSFIKKYFPDVASALQGDVDLYRKHRIKQMEGHNEIWEGHVKINLVFTFHYEYENGEKICFFRRVGTHAVYKRP